MNKQKRFRIVAELDGIYRVEELKQQTWCIVFSAGHGNEGLELAETWLADRNGQEGGEQ